MRLVRWRIFRGFSLKHKLKEIWEGLQVQKLYKREEGGGSRGLDVSITLRCRICDLSDYLCGVGASQLG